MGRCATGISIAFGTSSFTAELLNLSGPSISRGAIDNSHMGTTGGMPFLPTKLYDGGEVELEIAYDPDEQPPFNAAPEMITITYPTVTGESAGAECEFSGFVTEFTPEAPFEERLTAKIKIKVSGSITFTDSSA